jgi:hypothetical protein
MMGKRSRFRLSGVAAVIPVIATGAASCHAVEAAA